MAIQTTEGIILRKQNLRETSVILSLFTKDFGKISGVMKGARGPKAAMGNNPQVFSLNNIVFYDKKRGNLNSISQCDLKNYFDPIRNDLERTVYADYFLELVDSVTIEGDINREIYELLLNSLGLLSRPVSAKRVARIFEIKIMDMSGFMSELGECIVCSEPIQENARFSLCLGGPLCRKCQTKDKGAINLSKGTMNFIERVRRSPFELVSRIKVSQDVGIELEGFLRRFVDYHIQRSLKTVEFLKKIKL
ncbi:MAG: DNA repair protein RecO [Candidatus Omnitrophica bacterium]|nr:DNA repair protein RecO [Candidatus Omnitrophota bacterium]